MDESEVVAERSLLFVTPEHREITSSIQIGAPYPNDPHEWRCDCEIPNVEKRRYAAGIDGIQALLLAMSLLQSLLELRVAQGWRILWPDTRDGIVPSEIFEGTLRRESAQ